VFAELLYAERKKRGAWKRKEENGGVHELEKGGSVGGKKKHANRKTLGKSKEERTKRLTKIKAELRRARSSPSCSSKKKQRD